MITVFIYAMVFYWVVLGVMLYREAQNQKLALISLEKKLDTKSD